MRGNTFHIFWRCSVAQQVWRVLRDQWARFGLWDVETPGDQDSFQTAIFALRLPRTPSQLWSSAPIGVPPAASVTEVYEDLAAAWALQGLNGLQVIWRWCHSHHDGVLWHTRKALSTAAAAFTTAVARVRRAVDTTRSRSCSGIILATFVTPPADPAPSPPPAPPDPTTRYVLFFDGGSRGNPGPGGAGSVVLRVTSDGTGATLLWSAAMSLASRTTTNNQVEYVGLVTGLRAAHAHRWLPLSVVGDSMLVLRQLADYRPPHNVRLRSLFDDARLLAYRLGIARWTHHLRAWNKMADAAANVAMDCARSMQTFHPTDRPEWQGLPALLPGDFTQWQTSTSV